MLRNLKRSEVNSTRWPVVYLPFICSGVRDESYTKSKEYSPADGRALPQV